MVSYRLRCRDRELIFGRYPVIMGILNVTPDSFSDGGKYLHQEAAIERAIEMVNMGAGIIDIGGESSRPGSRPVSAEEQISRVVGIIESLANKVDVPISIDTTSSQVALAAMEAGASIINDISAMRSDGEIAKVAANSNAGIVLMHMQGVPGTMQKDPSYVDVVKEVKEFLSERIDAAIRAGIPRNQIVIDPGIGFGKKREHNLSLLKHSDEFSQLGLPVLLGPSRKRFIDDVLNIPDPDDRIFGTAAAVAWCAAGAADIIRVHDIKEMLQVSRLTAEIAQAK